MKSSDFTYENFSATRLGADPEDVDAPNPALLWVALLEQIPPQNDHAIAHSQDLFGLEPSPRHQLERTIQSSPDGRLAFEAAPLVSRRRCRGVTIAMTAPTSF
jgi:hypothetical protein